MGASSETRENHLPKSISFPPLSFNEITSHFGVHLEIRFSFGRGSMCSRYERNIYFLTERCIHFKPDVEYVLRSMNAGFIL